MVGLLVPRLSTYAIVVLSIWRHASAVSLLEVASRPANPLPLRKAAAVALNLNVQQFGLLLSQDSIRQQYIRYRQSDTQDPVAQQVLADVMSARSNSRATLLTLEAAANKPVRQRPSALPGRWLFPRWKSDGVLKIEN